MSIVDHTCLICRESVRVPVIPKLTHCLCKHIVCLTCYRDFLSLNRERNDRVNRRCFYNCDGELLTRNLNARSAYTKNYDLMTIIDNNPQLYGFENGVPCCKQGCNVVLNSQYDLEQHLFRYCLYSTTQCPYFCGTRGQRININAHMRQCYNRPIPKHERWTLVQKKR